MLPLTVKIGRSKKEKQAKTKRIWISTERCYRVRDLGVIQPKSGIVE